MSTTFRNSIAALTITILAGCGGGGGGIVDTGPADQTNIPNNGPTTMPNMKQTAVACVATLTTSCSGATDPGTFVPNSQLFLSTSPDVPLLVIGLDRTADTLFTETTDLTTPNTLSRGRLDGTVAYATSEGETNSIALSNGATATLVDEGTKFGFRFGTADMIGVAGIVTTTMPTSGLATYTGFADVLVNDGSGNPKSLTDASISASFVTGKVNVNLSNSSDDYININGADINGSTYVDGALSVSPTFATDPVTSGTLVHEGAFFNSNASEIGGVFTLDKTGNGTTFKAQGVYSGNDGS